jgi:DNA-binding transcriptional LysR family regulator
MRRYLPSLSSLQAFEAAATHLSFTRAGEDLGLTQSGVSRQIGNLEQQLGIRLFERFGPRLVLTDAGRAYAKSVTRILADLEEASIDVVRGSRATDALQIGVQDSMASRWLVPRMSEFLERNPDIHFNMMPLRTEVDLEDQELDVAVLRGRGAWPNALSFELVIEKVAVVAAPSLIDPAEEQAPEDHVNYLKIQNAHRPDSWLRWLEAKQLEHKGPISGPRFSQSTMVIEAALAGLGLAVLPTFLIQDHLEQGRLHLPFGPAVPSGFSYYVVYPERQSVSKPVLNFRDWIVSATRHLR